MRKSYVGVIALLLFGCSSETERLVKEQLIDPQSAQFSEVATKNGITCGLVNSKNRMGGYTGRQLFLVRDRQVYFWRDSPEVDQSMLSVCSTEAFTVALQDFDAEMRATTR
jgi:uncharacterized protein YcfL